MHACFEIELIVVEHMISVHLLKVDRVEPLEASKLDCLGEVAPILLLGNQKKQVCGGVPPEAVVPPRPIDLGVLGSCTIQFGDLGMLLNLNGINVDRTHLLSCKR